MAVQAQYPANLLLLHRGEADRRSNKDGDMNFHQASLSDQSPVFFSSNGGNVNPRKRDEQNLRQRSDSFLSAFVSEELVAQTKHQMDEIDQFILSQRDHLRRALIERRQQFHHSLLPAIEMLRNKEAEICVAARRTAELEYSLFRIRSESMAWQSKALAEQAAAASLRAQLQSAASGDDFSGDSPAKDAESVFIDPERPEAPGRACKSCFRRTASVVLIPCRHLCLCSACNFAVAGEGCPLCGCVITGSVPVFLS